MDRLAFIVGLVAFASWMATRCWFRVDEGTTAVLTSFGAALRDGKHLRTFAPGLHVKAPWQLAHHVSLKEQNLLLSGEDGGRTAMAEDGTVLRFDSILRFAPSKDDLDAYLFGLKRKKDHIVGLFTCLLRSEIANFRAANLGGGTDLVNAEDRARPAALVDAADVEGGPVSMATAMRIDGGSYALIRRERQLLNRRIESFVMDVIAEKSYGVHFSAVDLTDILPPDGLADALNAVLSASAGAAALYAHAQSDCYQRVLAAERGVEIARQRARAAELEIRTLSVFLEQLSRDSVLSAYVARRRTEVLSESKSVLYRCRT